MYLACCLAAERNESGSPHAGQVKPGLSSKAFLFQTLVLATIGYREKQRTETLFLRKSVLPCFAAVFSEQHDISVVQIYHDSTKLCNISVYDVVMSAPEFLMNPNPIQAQQNSLLELTTSPV